MSYVYISFLGTNDYLSCIYFHDSQEINHVRFVQEATVHLFCRSWDTDDRILIFTTEEAAKKNWKDDGHIDRNTKRPKKCMGLKQCIENLKPKPQVNRMLIPEGKSEDEIWQIFQIVFDQLKQGDKVIFDITHAFRSIPMLAVVILNYAKVMKDITIEGIYYGAFEVLGSIFEAKKIPIEKRRVPILDLTSFDQLLEWSIAVDRFLGAGDAEMVSKLARQSVKPVLQKSKGQDEIAATIREIANNLYLFSKALATCRGGDISDISCKLKESVNRFETMKIDRPFKPIFERIKSQTDRFSGNAVPDGIQAAKWCLEHNLVQQGYTILQETLTTFFISGIGLNPKKRPCREMAGQAATIYRKKIPETDWKHPASANKATIRDFLTFYEKESKLLKVYWDLSSSRNDLNHAGWSDNPMSSEKFGDKLKNCIEKIRAIMA